MHNLGKINIFVFYFVKWFPSILFLMGGLFKASLGQERCKVLIKEIYMFSALMNYDVYRWLFNIRAKPIEQFKLIQAFVKILF